VGKGSRGNPFERFPLAYLCILSVRAERMCPRGMSAEKMLLGTSAEKMLLGTSIKKMLPGTSAEKKRLLAKEKAPGLHREPFVMARSVGQTP
jgi:hypothetical protein